ncbi:uroporphyrinogen-III synthase [Asaia sp. W19]|uniref:uroporphyrinogen-III synthase n=1 Tax=unclassified Asaia TaxID=2685023 RepID=UPI000F8C808A|nr:uroporphyrinogen-III synthase [Asaia sp. W19]RUT26663.1 uroporphyrinogen-III synthase [Asaia sp. W19]
MADAAKRSVLVTRPEPGLSDTCHALERLGWTPCVAPMLRIIPLPLRATGTFDRVVITSAQSLDALRASVPLDIPLTAVGAKTAERARTLGFVQVDHASGTAESLIPHLGRADKAQPSHERSLLLATGRNLGADLATQLRAGGWRVQRRVVYRTEPEAALTAHARALLHEERVAAILFYSAVTAAAFLDALGSDRAFLRSVRALALSSRIASVLHQAPFGEIAIASQPDQNSLLRLLGPLPLHGHTQDWRPDTP